MGVEEFKGVWVFSENYELAYQLLGKGREIADKLKVELVVVSLGAGAVERGKVLIARGADKVYAAEDPALKTFQVETYTDALAGLILQHKPEMVIIGGSRKGKELAPRIATRLKVGCIPGATAVELDEDKRQLVATRVLYGGNLFSVESCVLKPQIVSVLPRSYEPLPPDGGRRGEVVEVKVQVNPSPTTLLEVKPKEKGTVKLEDADIIVSLGRGVKKPEDIAMIKALAEALGGQLGCSRPIAADYRWLPEEHWVGLSGRTVKPKVYVACGISGQIQHLAGMRDSKKILVINKDREAPFFKACDYGIVGDIYEVVPKLTVAVKGLIKG